MVRLNEGGWRLYNTTDNVRWLQLTDSSYSQRDLKQKQLKGSSDPILWEVAFVNFNVENQCKEYI